MEPKSVLVTALPAFAGMPKYPRIPSFRPSKGDSYCGRCLRMQLLRRPLNTNGKRYIVRHCTNTKLVMPDYRRPPAKRTMPRFIFRIGKKKEIKLYSRASFWNAAMQIPYICVRLCSRTVPSAIHDIYVRRPSLRGHTSHVHGRMHGKTRKPPRAGYFQSTTMSVVSSVNILVLRVVPS